MSRIGKQPIPIPNGVELAVDGPRVTVKGPKGELSMELEGEVTVAEDDGNIVVTRANDARRNRALHGLYRALLANMVTGVSEGFRRDLEIVGVGYRANAQGPTKLELALGYSHSISFEAPEGVTFDVPEPTKIGVVGIDKQLVGQVAADIRKLRKPEPYKGKGIRYAGERIKRKAGKAGVAGA